ncbi:MAG: SulP family inorganic anion transporter, partial [Leptospiraceae bacterium]|nr:SulP family inorganic anion transporter [Leptospiraceae bacterium]
VEFFKKIKSIPAPLMAVLIGLFINEYFKSFDSEKVLGNYLLVNLPAPEHFAGFIEYLKFPDFTAITNVQVYQIAITIAIVASIETLLSIEAADKLDPKKVFTDTNRELKAQGVGNIISSLLGGMPMTSVIVRTSANVQSGAKSKISTISHGIFLLISVLLAPTFLNRIPLAGLASVLLMVGYKLASPRIFKLKWKQGINQFIPFIATVIAVVSLDLLKGVAIGLCIAIFYILKANLQFAYHFSNDQYHEGETITIHLAQEVSFLNKAAIKQTLFDLPENSKIIIDATNNIYIDFDVIQLIKDFILHSSKDKNIHVRLRGFKKHHNMEEFNHVKIEH